MSYLTRSDLTNYVPEQTLAMLTDDQTGQAVNEVVVAEALLEANTTVDNFLRQRYVLPLIETAPELRAWAGAIARHALYLRRPDGGQDLPPAVVRGYTTALAFLRQVVKGELSLVVRDSSTGSGDGDGGGAMANTSKSRVRTKPRQFGANEWAQY